MTTFIYGLKDPETGEIRYIGKSDYPQRRLSEHLKDRDRCHRTFWIQSLRLRGLFPVLEILDEVPTHKWEFFERAYIKIYREAGFDLTNQADGGDCGPNCAGRKQSAEERHSHRLAALGRVKTPEECARISASKTGYKNPMFGKSPSAEHRRKVAAGNRGKTVTPETCKLLSEFQSARQEKLSSSGYYLKPGRPLRSTNTSGFTGVSWEPVSQKWKAHFVGVDHKMRRLGLFGSKEDAVFVRALSVALYLGGLVT